MHRLQEVFGLQGEFAPSSKLVNYSVVYRRGLFLLEYQSGIYPADRHSEGKDWSKLFNSRKVDRPRVLTTRHPRNVIPRVM